MGTYDRKFFRSKLGKVAKLCIVATLAMNVVALHAQLHPHGEAQAASELEVT